MLIKNQADHIFIIIFNNVMLIQMVEASRGAVAQRVPVKSTGCGFDPHLRR